MRLMTVVFSSSGLLSASRCGRRSGVDGAEFVVVEGERVDADRECECDRAEGIEGGLVGAGLVAAQL